MTESFRLHYSPGVKSASKRNGYHEYFLEIKGDWCVRLTMLPPPCADCLEIWQLKTLGNLWPYNGPEQELLYHWFI
jgi:hypothetical protein